MTDNEIIKALECCSDAKAECSSCPLYHMKYACCTGCTGCGPVLIYNALGLIKRQKEEIGKAKSEAVREFAEKLKRKSELVAPSVWAIPYRAVAVTDIDKLVEEME